MRKTPVVMGVLAMVFGGLQALMSGGTLVTGLFSKQIMGSMEKAFSEMPRQPGDPDVGTLMAQSAKLAEELKLYTYLTGFGMVAFSIALIIVGYLLYKRRAQSRKLTIAWAIAALIYLPIQIWVQVMIILPRTQAVTEQMVKGMNKAAVELAQGMASWQSIGTVIYQLTFYAPFPILLLWLIGRQSAKNDLLPAQMP
jgi:hypothetical protein